MLVNSYFGYATPTTSNKGCREGNFSPYLVHTLSCGCQRIDNSASYSFLSRQVWCQFKDPGGMEGLVDPGGNSRTMNGLGVYTEVGASSYCAHRLNILTTTMADQD